MESKRKATTDLNHENWDRDEEPEERGTFQKASEDILKNRVIKKARRNIAPGESSASKSVFSGFSGFSQSASTLSATSSSPFSFLSKMTPTPPTPAKTASTKPDEADNQFDFEKSSTYYSKLKSLNQAVSDWIKTHVDKNPLCILSPIFKDYEKYLKEIQEERSESVVTTAASSTSFKFGSLPTNVSSSPKLEEKTSPKPAIPKFSFGTVNSTTDTKPGSSIFGPKADTKDNKFAEFSFKTTQSSLEPSSSKSSIFSTASSTSGVENPACSSVTGFSFSSGKPFTFGSGVTVQPAETQSKDGNDAEDDEPPKVEFTPVVEKDSVYSKRCKVFIKSDGNYTDRGVGTLFLKSVQDSDKIQLIVRADTSLGNILLNFILNESIPAQRLGKNNVMMVCIPTPDADPKPTSILLRVKTGEEADDLLSTIEKYKNQ